MVQCVGTDAYRIVFCLYLPLCMLGVQTAHKQAHRIWQRSIELGQVDCDDSGTEIGHVHNAGGVRK